MDPFFLKAAHNLTSLADIRNGCIVGKDRKQHIFVPSMT